MSALCALGRYFSKTLLSDVSLIPSDKIAFACQF